MGHHSSWTTREPSAYTRLHRYVQALSLCVSLPVLICDTHNATEHVTPPLLWKPHVQHGQIALDAAPGGCAAVKSAALQPVWGSAVTLPPQEPLLDSPVYVVLDVAPGGFTAAATTALHLSWGAVRTAGVQSPDVAPSTCPATCRRPPRRTNTSPECFMLCCCGSI